MNKRFHGFLATILLIFVSHVGFAQTSVSGKVTDESGEALIGVNITVQGTVLGTVTDLDGNFSLSISSAPPVTLVISSVGFERQQLEITSANTSGLEISMSEAALLGQEVVVSASRVEESIMQSPVSIEKMDILALQNTSADDYYKAIMNLKGVDMTSSSINFQIINTRGFSSTGNTRFVQLTDGMDTQAPALNFPIGNLNGPSVLDVESLELLPGASSALYGPNAFNGILLVTSKNPFDYQGTSAYAKVGVNHVGSDADQATAPLYDMSVRWAKAYNNKIAFKTTLSYSRADDWHGTTLRDRNLTNNPFGDAGPNPGVDALHLHGDEAGLNLNILRFSNTGDDNGNGVLDPDEVGWQTQAERDGVFQPGLTAWNYAQNGFLPSQVANTPGYAEELIVDYGAENIKANAGVFYRINDQLELSYLFNGGAGTSVYTGAQRYSLKNFAIFQHRLQLRSDNFFVRAYTTRERSGDSYIAEFSGIKLNEGRFGSLNNYFGSYAVEYLRSIYDAGYGLTDDPNSVTQADQIAAHQFARNQVENVLYPLEIGSSEFEDLRLGAFEDRNGEPLKVPDGPVFDDQSNLYQIDAQYDFSNEIDFMELQVGGSYRLFELRSNGTIFDDIGGRAIQEYGVYVQAGKRIIPDFKLSGSIRYDKNENFDGQFNPRISGVYTVGENHNFRASYQTGFRFPTTQGQFIDLDILSSRLLGGLPRFYEKYDIPKFSSTGQPLTYTLGSVLNWRNSVFAGNEDRSVLETFTEAKPVRPEQVQSFEFGYKSLIGDNLLFEAVYYHNFFTSFITQVALVNADEAVQENIDVDPTLTTGGTFYSSMLLGSSANTFSIYSNLDDDVETQGLATGFTYSFNTGYQFGVNYNWNKFIGGFSNDVLNDFNTPEHKFNINFGNRRVTDKLGFNMTYRWQEAFRWESSFAIGNVPAYDNLDIQLSYKLEDLNSILRVGGSNVLNEPYFQSLGGPNIGAIYYVSITWDTAMN